MRYSPRAVRVLFLSQRVPYPPNRGDKITTWRLVDRMRRDHEVEVIAFAHGDADVAAARELTALGVLTVPVPFHERSARIRSLPLLLTRKPLTLGVYGSREVRAEVDRRIGWADVAYAYSSSMGAFLLPHADVRRVMHFAELDSDKWRQYSQRTRFPMSWVYRREWRTLLAFERRVAHAVDESVFCTPLEERVFREAIPGPAATVLRNGVDLEFYRPEPDAAEEDHLVFTGVMNYYPNVDGCRWFVEEVLPRVREERPETRFSIVGAHPTPVVERLAESEGVTVTGFVDDTRDWLRRASVSVAPLRIARGIQNKVLEALAMGLPVVGTTSATQGTEGAPGQHFLLADDAAHFAESVLSLLRDRSAARALGERGRRFVEQNYDWEVVLDPLDRILFGPNLACPPDGRTRTMSHESIASEFDAWVDRGRADSLEEHHGNVVLQVLDRITIGPGHKVLDLGCGNGWVTRLFGQAAPGSQGIGVDCSPKMIARAEELHAYTIRARYEVGAFEKLDFKDESFDRVFSMEALYYAVDLDSALAEAHRVLKPGGALDAIVDFYRDRPATEGWQESIGVPMQFLSEAEWVERFEKAGFGDVRTSRVIDSRGPGDPESFEPSEWYPSWEDRVAMHEAGSLWIAGRK